VIHVDVRVRWFPARCFLCERGIGPTQLVDALISLFYLFWATEVRVKHHVAQHASFRDDDGAHAGVDLCLTQGVEIGMKDFTVPFDEAQ